MDDDRRAALEGIAYGRDERIAPGDRLRGSEADAAAKLQAFIDAQS